MAKHDRKLMADLAAIGFEPGRRTKHGLQLTHPCGARMHMSGTPSDHRAGLNVLAEARRTLRQHMTTNPKEQ